MKRIKIILGFSVVISITVIGLIGGVTYSQSITDDIPSDVRKEIERLNSSDPVERGKAALRLGQIGARAAVAAPFLIRILDDDARV